MNQFWEALKDHHAAVEGRPILDLFAEADRAQTFSAQADGMILDYAKTNIDARGLGLLMQLAESAGVASKRDAMFTGDRINETEGRAVLHTALRNLDAAVVVDGSDVMPPVRDTYARMQAFADDVRNGRFIG
ncbi:MAG: glucose-6-phosphate isomerase, partial [Paracoccaceae bacterium]